VAVVREQCEGGNVALARLTQHQPLGHQDRPLYRQTFVVTVFRLGNHGIFLQKTKKGDGGPSPLILFWLCQTPVP
jgi:hypothetical protein